ncbi:MAG: aminodeoxychorismate synthase component I [Thermodesulfobacteriota bacterium]|nr:aminodeoxychorismate synthase component I [Thermodesulfobacteriota bacterium]
MNKTGLNIEAHPCQVFRAVRHEPGAIFLETQKPSFANRHSFVAWEPEKVFKGDITGLSRAELFSFLSSMTPHYFVAGYIGYEACQWIENLPLPGTKDTPNPHIYLAAYRRFLVFDHIQKTWHCWHNGSPLSPPLSLLKRRESPAGRITGFNQSKVTYLENVRRVLDYIRAGDVYQINYTQRAYFTCPADPFDIYLRLKEIQPVSYAAFVNLGDGLVISGSPELFLRLRNNRILSKPMKGTRKRSPEASIDRGLRKELQESGKDRAENTMIVDLMRNDLGRFCLYRSIAVPRPYVVEAYDTVYQMVSYVRGVTRSDTSISDIIGATFPPGSITGAPKKRAMEIIYELEPHERGVYCGAMGYFFQDKMVLNVAIRTLELWQGEGVLGVGGGIVADSDPELEYEESIIKAKASMMALGIAQ